MQLLDIGCGEGALLSCLAQPSREKYDANRPLDTDISSRSLDLTHLAGLDISEHEINAAAECTAPTEFDVDAPRYAMNGTPRWDELEVKLWYGGFEALNEDFLEKYECIVSTEV